MSDEYDLAARGKLKLKSSSHISKKKKKKKSKGTRDKAEEEQLQRALNDSFDEGPVQRSKATTNTNSVTTSGGSELTKAEIAFKQQQEKMRNKRIMEKASTTHKERVEKFNEHLDTLTEHFDIPKVSWTK